MSAENAPTPRIFTIRHGETEWSQSGRLTSFTEIDLTSAGATQVSSTAALLVGNGKLIDPRRIGHIFISPRTRTQKTWSLMLPNFSDLDEQKITLAEDITEWNYGNYEGMMKEEVKLLRETKGYRQTPDWNVWINRCEGGESVQQVTDRLDKFILKIKELQCPHMHGTGPADIVIVSHGLILRCLVKRWLGYQISDQLSLILEPSAIRVLSYKNKNIEEPALHVGIPLPS